MISSNLTTNDTTVIEMIELHPQERQLLLVLRNKFRFGDITVKMRDGLPFRLVRITEFEDLTT